MAAMIMFSMLLCWTLLANAYPYYNDRWTPEEVAAYLSETVMTPSKIPVEDTSFDSSNQGLGSVTAVDVDSHGDLFVFHRADRPWTYNTFEAATDKLSPQARIPISQDTIYKLDPVTGRLISSFGANIFNVPHGLSVDDHDNIWVTDVGRHQVFRIPGNASTPDLVLGEKFVPGSDDAHFCKPTDVAVASSGEFFVSDGYCNARILKYSKDAKVIAQWGTKTSDDELTPFTMNTPHSITLVEELDLVCVADRENSRALCYNAGLTNNKVAGTFNRTVVPEDDAGKVYAIDYNRADQEMIIASWISDEPYRSLDDEVVFPPRAFTYSLDGQQKNAWAYITPEIARDGPSAIHDLCSSHDGRDFYLADLMQQKVLKYTKNQPYLSA